MTYSTLLLKLRLLSLRSLILLRFKSHYFNETFHNFQNVLTCYYSVSFSIVFLDVLCLNIFHLRVRCLHKHCSSCSQSLSLLLLFQSFPLKPHRLITHPMSLKLHDFVTYTHTHAVNQTSKNNTI